MTVDRGGGSWPCRGTTDTLDALIDGSPHMTIVRLRAAVAAALLAIAVVAYWTLRPGDTPKPERARRRPPRRTPCPRPGRRRPSDSSSSRSKSSRSRSANSRSKRRHRQHWLQRGYDGPGVHAVSGPDHRAVRQVGNDVRRPTLFTIDSPDLLQAESTLIAAAGVLELNGKNLARLRDLFTTRAVSQHDVEQAASDEQTAEGKPRRRVTRCGCSARPTPTSTPSSPSAAPIRPWWGPTRPAAASLPAMRCRLCHPQPGNEAGAVHGRRHQDHVECWGTSRRPIARRSASGNSCRSRSARFPAACSMARSPLSLRPRPKPAASWCARRSAIRSTTYARTSSPISSSGRRAGAFACDRGRRRGARRRRHDDGLGHGRSPPFHRVQRSRSGKNATATGRFSTACRRANSSPPKARCS